MAKKPTKNLLLQFDSTSSRYIRRVVVGEHSISQNQVKNGLKEQSDYDREWLKSPSRKIRRHDGTEIRCADLFSGCGGLSLGVREACDTLQLKFTPVLAWDILDSAVKVYEDNFSVKPRSEKIEKVIDGVIGQPFTPKEKKLLKEIGRIDIVVGGPPCQGNSDLNNHSRRDDPRNELYMRATRFIEITKPKFAIIENVVAVRKAKANVIERTNNYLRDWGYECSEFTIRGLDVGIPQARNRHFTLAWRVPICDLNSLKLRVEQHRTLRWAIEDLPSIPEKSDDIFTTPANSVERNVNRMQYLLDHGLYDLPNKERPPCHQNGHTYPAVYGRLKWDEPTPTITTGFGSNGQGRFQHPDHARTLTPHEAARVQTFPDYFKFDGVDGRRKLQILIGNAVPPIMGYHVALRILALQSTKLSQ